MTEFSPTADQLQALTATGSDILVSASAGAGKTKILVERIVRQLQQGEQIDHLLIVTFTEAAAQEMKQRLLQQVQLAAQRATEPQLVQHLRAQLAKIPGACISTLHAFCLQVIRKFYYLIDLDPVFRLLSDSNERFLLQERAWQQVRSAYYQAADRDFLALENNFATGNDDSEVENLFFKLTDFALTNENPQQWLHKLATDYQVVGDVSAASFYQEYFVDFLEQQLHYLVLQVSDLAEQATNFTELNGYQPSVETLLQQVNALLTDLRHLKWDQLRQRVLALTPIKGRAKAKSDISIVEPFKAKKKAVSQLIQEWQYKYFVLDNRQWCQLLQASAHLIDKVVEVEERFLTAFQKQKQRQHSLDFNDLEHYCLKILQVDYQGQRVAQEYYRTLFHEILVDEYQDTNPLQEAIIQQIKQSTPGNLFMVGDVKQSIYGFRQAAPFLFTHKFQAMQQDPTVGQLINLTTNFRSHPNVLATVNEIFRHIMDQTLGEVDYDQTAQLQAGSHFSPQCDATSEVLFLQQSSLTEEHLTNEQAQIQLIIQRIQELKAANLQVYDRQTQRLRSLRYSDIAILTRVKSLNNDLIEQFSQAQIPIVVHDAANYFQATEVQVMLSMLKIIDNPQQDIALVAVLRSAIVGLDENELAYLRINQRGDNYYQRVEHYLKDREYNQKNAFAQRLTQKVTTFMEQLTSFRQLAPKISLAALIWQVYLKTGYLSYVQGMPNGSQRVSNLHALYQRADEFEQQGFKGLFQFIHFIEHIEDNDQDLSQPVEHHGQQDEVQVLTIHGSKGLEFPIVFVLNLDHSFNLMDVRKRYLLDAQQGMGLKYLDTQTHVFYETLPMTALKANQKNKVLSEEIRLLYVALTRAQQKLILVGSVKDDPEVAFEKWQVGLTPETTVLDIGLRSNFHSFQEMLQPILALNGTLKQQDEAMVIEPKSSSTFQFVARFMEVPSEKNTPLLTPPNDQTTATSAPEVDNLFMKTARQILDFQYPQQIATTTTAYQSVSEIKHLFANPDDQTLPTLDLQAKSTPGQRYVLNDFKRPKFLSQDKSQVTPADVGSATHLLLQKITLTKTPTQQDFQALAQQLVAQKALSANVAQKIDFGSLENFYASTLGQQIIANQKTLHREWTFSMVLPAQQIFPQQQLGDDQILVHGIIDGLFVNQAQQVVLFDYKTDHVNLRQATGEHSVKQIVQKYSGQLNLYQQAAQQILQLPVVDKFLCLLSVNQIIKVN